jgi:hypothetical protein
MLGLGMFLSWMWINDLRHDAQEVKRDG